MVLGVQLDRITPGHPEQNGGHERMRCGMKKEPQGQTGGTLGGDMKMFLTNGAMYLIRPVRMKRLE
ncbi:MAG: transposase [Treponema sp.]|jgi:hypothetical protein|nr:transposase [Treponema sp.]